MNKLRRYVLSTFVVIALNASAVQPQNASRTDQLVRRSAHPYLTYSDANIARLKQRIANEPAIAEAWSKMLAQANLLLERPATTGQGRRGQGQANDTELLCLAYRMTGGP